MIDEPGLGANSAQITFVSSRCTKVQTEDFGAGLGEDRVLNNPGTNLGCAITKDRRISRCALRAIQNQGGGVARGVPVQVDLSVLVRAYVNAAPAN